MIWLAARVHDFYYTLGGPQLNTVRLTHSRAVCCTNSKCTQQNADWCDAMFSTWFRSEHAPFQKKKFLVDEHAWIRTQNSSGTKRGPGRWLELLFPTPSTNLFRELPQSPQERCAMVRTSCAPRQEMIFACEFAISFWYQIVEETEI